MGQQGSSASHTKSLRLVRNQDGRLGSATSRVGCCGSCAVGHRDGRFDVVAGTVARSAKVVSQRHFRTGSAEIASTLQLAIEHEQDLIVSASGFVIGNPTHLTRQFVAWARSVHALARYPELLGFGHSVIVPAARAGSVRGARGTRPIGRSAGCQWHLARSCRPVGAPFYCLSVGSLTRGAPRPSRLASTSAQRSRGSRVAHVSRFGPGCVSADPDGKRHAVVGPHARVSGWRSRACDRRRTSPRIPGLGWDVAGAGQLILARALQGHPDTALTFRYHDGPWNAAFRSGKAPSGAQSTTVSLHNGWTVETYRCRGRRRHLR